MTNVFLEILNMSINAIWLVLSVLILRLLLKKAPKWIRVVLWAIVAVRLVCPVFVESEMSLIPRTKYVLSSEVLEGNTSEILEGYASEVLEGSTSEVLEGNTSEVLEGNTSEISEGSTSEVLEGNTSEVLEGNTSEVLEGNTSEVLEGNTSEISEKDSHTGQSGTEKPAVSDSENNGFYKTLIPTISKIWVLGMGLMLLYFFVSYASLSKKVKTAVCLKDKVFQSENVNSPFVLGVFSPKIYIPFNANESDVLFVVAHEKAHISRMDYLWKPLGFLLLALHWFNPFVWVAYVLLCKDIELACDEKVIKGMNDTQKADYAQALLYFTTGKRSVSACPVAFGETVIKGRIGSVLKYKKPTLWIVVIAVVSCVLLVALFLTNPKEDESGKLSTEGTSSSMDTQSSDTLSEPLQSSDASSGDSEASEEASGEEVPLNIKVQYKGFDDSELDFTDTYDGSYYQITVNKTIENFKFIRIFYDEKGHPYECGTLYGTELLTPNNAFSVKTQIRPRFSNRGISYTDENGKACFALISYDEKGYIALTPFENPVRKETEITVFSFFGNLWRNMTFTFDGTVSGLVSELTNRGVLTNGIDVNFFYIEKGVAHIDFNHVYSDFLSAHKDEHVIGAVVNSLMAYYGDKGVERVLITVCDAKEIRFENRLFHGEIGVENNEDNGKHYALLTMIDINALKEYYYPTVFDGTVSGLISALAKECGWGEGIKVNSFEIKGNTAYINFNEEFGDGVDVVIEEEPRVYCVRDAIKSYYNVSNVEITMSEG